MGRINQGNGDSDQNGCCTHLIKVHTNGMENYWSLLKRAIKGTYVSVEPFHLFRYLDEQAYRFNERKQTDRQRFEGLLGMVAGKRLDYNTLTGECVSYVLEAP